MAQPNSVLEKDGQVPLFRQGISGMFLSFLSKEAGGSRGIEVRRQQYCV